MIKTIEEFADTYKDERYFTDFLERYPSWIENVETDEERTILSKIVVKMTFFSKVDIKRNLRDKILHYKLIYNELEKSHILPMISENRRHNGAYELIQQIVELDKESYYRGEELLPYKDTVIYDVREIREDVDTIIIVDDICGTGGTLEKFLEKNKDYFLNKKLIILFFVVTKVAEEKFEKLKIQYKGLEIDYIQIEDKLYNSEYLSEKEFEILRNIERSLWNQGSKNILGFRDSQLLIGFSHNIPNNTISSIWYKPALGRRDNWNELFTRYTKKNRPQRKAQNYNVAKSK